MSVESASEMDALCNIQTETTSDVCMSGGSASGNEKLQESGQAWRKNNDDANAQLVRLTNKDNAEEANNKKTAYPLDMSVESASEMDALCNIQTETTSDVCMSGGSASGNEKLQESGQAWRKNNYSQSARSEDEEEIQ
ncbi:hypothetical protein ABG067_007368 [Albugo candida]